MRGSLGRRLLVWFWVPVFPWVVAGPTFAVDRAQPYNYYADFTPWENAAPTSGAGPRDNGWDMDDDGVWGEAGVDDKHCDETGGTSAGTRGAYVEDVDTGGLDESGSPLERQWFIAGSTGLPTAWAGGSGTDDANCGEPDDPCATIGQAITNYNNDDSTETGEPIFCLVGDISGNLPDDIPSGNAGTWTMAVDTVSLSERNAFEYATNPTIVSGVDADDDGIYPPNDPDDGTDFTDTETNIFWQMGSADGDRIWVGHFEAGGWASGASSRENFNVIDQDGGASLRSHLRLNDTLWIDPHRDQCHASDTIFYSFFAANREYFDLSFNETQRMNAYVMRGGVVGQYHRIRANIWDIQGGGRSSNTNEVGTGCSNSGGQNSIVYRVWGLNGGDNTTPVADEVEFIDNIVRNAGWQSGANNGANFNAGTLLCGNRGWYLIGNLVQDVTSLGVVTHTDGICDSNGTSQSAGDWYFERNRLTRPNADLAAYSVNRNILMNVSNGNNNTIGGLRGDIHFKHNEWDFTEHPTDDNGSEFSMLLWQASSGTDGYSLVDFVSEDNEARGCMQVGFATILDIPALGTDMPDDVTIRRITLWEEGGCSISSTSMDIPDLSDIANLTIDDIELSHCEADLDGSNETTEGGMEANSGVSNIDCSPSVAPTMGNFANAQSEGSTGAGASFGVHN